MPSRIVPKIPPRLYLKEWRELRGYTQEELADRAGTTQSTIGKYERGERRPDIDVLAAIAEALDLRADDLLRDPHRPSADRLLRGQPPEVIGQVFKVIAALIK
jgi:transcriptional regulator with XRE-family HTH domain